MCCVAWRRRSFCLLFCCWSGLVLFGGRDDDRDIEFVVQAAVVIVVASAEFVVLESSVYETVLGGGVRGAADPCGVCGTVVVFGVVAVDAFVAADVFDDSTSKTAAGVACYGANAAVCLGGDACDVVFVVVVVGCDNASQHFDC